MDTVFDFILQFMICIKFCISALSMVHLFSFRRIIELIMTLILFRLNIKHLTFESYYLLLFVHLDSTMN